jgi:hypothetical protein
MHTATLDWLLDGDPVIRWQTQRDLLDEPKAVWSKERRKTLEQGWGAAFLAAMQPDLTWPKGRWTDTVWTLLVIMDCGLPPDHPPLRAAAQKFIDSNLTAERAGDAKWLMQRMDLCHLGFWLRIGGYFLGKDQRLADTAKTVAAARLGDGGFNCHIRNYPETRHSSFHTTFNVLEGLAEAAAAGVISAEALRVAQAPALEFMLAHRMYRSHRTGKVISERFTHLAHPSHWHYTVLRGLDYMRSAPEIGDARLDDPIALLASRRKANGRWPVEKRIPGIEHFDMEKPGSDSRWNTLRVLRILKAREAAAQKAGG